MVSDTNRTSGAVASFRSFVTDQALPLWAVAGWDDADGGFVERLRSDGTPDRAAPRTAAVQTQQICNFAKAAQFDWHPNAKSIAIAAADHFLDPLRQNIADNGIPHLIDSKGVVLDAARHTSDQAFALLALANVHQLTRDAQIRQTIDDLLLFIDRKLRSSHGGFAEGLPSFLPRRQYPQMIMFEAMITLYDTTSEPIFQQRAGEFFGMMVANLLDPHSRTIGEFYDDDWSSILPAQIVPGHLAQWVWLLRGFERTTGCPTGRHRSMLMPSILRYRDVTTGFLADEGDRAGIVTQPSHALWSQLALAKSWIAQHEAGEPDAAAEAGAMLDKIRLSYLDHPVRGGWYMRINEHPIASDAIDASALYQIISAASEAEQVLEK